MTKEEIDTALEGLGFRAHPSAWLLSWKFETMSVHWLLDALSFNLTDCHGRVVSVSAHVTAAEIDALGDKGLSIKSILRLIIGTLHSSSREARKGIDRLIESPAPLEALRRPETP